MPDHREYDTRLAAYAVIARDGAVLLVRLNGTGATGHWTLPGGGVELHESPEDGAVREVLEETGHTVELVRLLGVHSLVLEPSQARYSVLPRTLRSIRVVYEATVTGGELRHEADGTTDQARWVPLADVPGLDRVSLVDVGLGYAGLR
ncbi:MAG: NUDIX domain-containing protein [Thermoleophilia bacterium]